MNMGNNLSLVFLKLFFNREKLQYEKLTFSK